MKTITTWMVAFGLVVFCLDCNNPVFADDQLDWPNAEHYVIPRVDFGRDSPAFVQYGVSDGIVCYVVITRGQRDAALKLTFSKSMVKGHIKTNDSDQPPPTKQMNAVEVNSGKVLARTNISISEARLTAILKDDDRLTLKSLTDDSKKKEPREKMPSKNGARLK